MIRIETLKKWLAPAAPKPTRENADDRELLLVEIERRVAQAAILYRVREETVVREIMQRIADRRR